MINENIVNDISMESLSIHAKEILLEKNPFKISKLKIIDMLNCIRTSSLTLIF